MLPLNQYNTDPPHALACAKTERAGFFGTELQDHGPANRSKPQFGPPSYLVGETEWDEGKLPQAVGGGV